MDAIITINNHDWMVKEVSRAEMKDIAGEKEDEYVQGITIYSRQTIYIDSEIANKRKTLIHELTHVWLDEFGHNQSAKEFNNEDVCEIVASIHDCINWALEVIDKQE